MSSIPQVRRRFIIALATVLTCAVVAQAMLVRYQMAEHLTPGSLPMPARPGRYYVTRAEANGWLRVADRGRR